MTAIITGVTGLIARNLMRALAQLGQRGIGVSRTPHPGPHDNLVGWHA